jgi:hypothetical protein
MIFLSSRLPVDISGPNQATTCRRARCESPYRVPPPPRDARAADPDDDDASTRRLVVAATLFILLWSLLRLQNPLFGSEEFGIDPYLALIAAVVSGVFLAKVVAPWCKRRLRRDRARSTRGAGGARGSLLAQGSARIAASILSWK